ncbi:hypothetical protein B0H11DRAFT_1915082 [Mycena galericulata]|nr:hypothetical protein B0H11DRAFT_1915082 [Mycena galericulata]
MSAVPLAELTLVSWAIQISGQVLSLVPLTDAFQWAWDDHSLCVYPERITTPVRMKLHVYQINLQIVVSSRLLDPVHKYAQDIPVSMINLNSDSKREKTRVFSKVDITASWNRLWISILKDKDLHDKFPAKFTGVSGGVFPYSSQPPGALAESPVPPGFPIRLFRAAVARFAGPLFDFFIPPRGPLGLCFKKLSCAARDLLYGGAATGGAVPLTIKFGVPSSGAYAGHRQAPGHYLIGLSGIEVKQAQNGQGRSDIERVALRTGQGEPREVAASSSALRDPITDDSTRNRLTADPNSAKTLSLFIPVYAIRLPPYAHHVPVGQTYSTFVAGFFSRVLANP